MGRFPSHSPTSSPLVTTAGGACLTTESSPGIEGNIHSRSGPAVAVARPLCAPDLASRCPPPKQAHRWLPIRLQASMMAWNNFADSAPKYRSLDVGRIHFTSGTLA
jgi:hypothetical protein